MIRSEKSIETALNRRVKKANGLSVKLQFTGIKGMPDRLIVIPRHKNKLIELYIPTQIWFVEVKRPGEKLSKLQLYWAKRLEEMGCNYFSILNEKDSHEFYKICSI